MLYSLLVLSPPYEDIYALDPGQLAALPFEITTGSSLNIITVHTMLNSQDYSLRAWVSREPGGGEIAISPFNVTHWSPNRAVGEIVNVRESTAEQQSTTEIVLPSGQYFLCVLNLGNSPNSFSAALTPTS